MTEIEDQKKVRARNYALRHYSYPDPIPNEWGLTWMQTECLRLAAEGIMFERIGERLSVSRKAVEDHVARAKKRMRAKTLAHAVVLWDRHIRGGEK